MGASALKNLFSERFCLYYTARDRVLLLIRDPDIDTDDLIHFRTPGFELGLSALILCYYWITIKSLTRSLASQPRPIKGARDPALDRMSSCSLRGVHGVARACPSSRSDSSPPRPPVHRCRQLDSRHWLQSWMGHFFVPRPGEAAAVRTFRPSNSLSRSFQPAARVHSGSRRPRAGSCTTNRIRKCAQCRKSASSSMTAHSTSTAVVALPHLRTQ